LKGAAFVFSNYSSSWYVLSRTLLTVRCSQFWPRRVTKTSYSVRTVTRQKYHSGDVGVWGKQVTRGFTEQTSWTYWRRVSELYVFMFHFPNSLFSNSNVHPNLYIKT